VNQIVEWLHEKNPEVAGEIDEQVDLIEGRLIDSLDFLEFIYLLEEVSGSAIDLSTVTVDDFRTLRSINERFLVVPAPAE
jgi:acyl carrier protein